MCIRCVCVYMPVHMCGDTHAHIHTGQSLTSGIFVVGFLVGFFFLITLFYFLRQGLSLNLELFN